MKANIFIIGADIAGLATIHEILTANPDPKVLILLFLFTATHITISHNV